MGSQLFKSVNLFLQKKMYLFIRKREGEIRKGSFHPLAYSPNGCSGRGLHRLSGNFFRVIHMVAGALALCHLPVLFPVHYQGAASLEKFYLYRETELK